MDWHWNANVTFQTPSKNVKFPSIFTGPSVIWEKHARLWTSKSQSCDERSSRGCGCKELLKITDVDVEIASFTKEVPVGKESSLKFPSFVVSMSRTATIALCRSKPWRPRFQNVQMEPCTTAVKVKNLTHLDGVPGVKLLHSIYAITSQDQVPANDQVPRHQFLWDSKDKAIFPSMKGYKNCGISWREKPWDPPRPVPEPLWLQLIASIFKKPCCLHLPPKRRCIENRCWYTVYRCILFTVDQPVNPHQGCKHVRVDIN